MENLTYKDFTGSVAWSEEDRVFYGKLIGIDDLVNFEGENHKEVEMAFREAVDDYIETKRILREE